MGAVSSGAKFRSVPSTTNTTEKKSASLNNGQEYHSIEEITTATNVYDNSSSGLTATTFQAAIDELDTNQDTIGVPTYAEVACSQSDIANMGTTPIPILGAPGANKYYDVSKVIIEFDYTSGSAFTFATANNFISLWDSKGYGFNFHVSLFTSTTDGVGLATQGASVVEPTLPEYAISKERGINSGLDLSNYAGDDPTGGDTCTALVKIWYTVRTLGTEL